MTDYFIPTEPNYMMPPPKAEERLSEPIIPTGKLGATVAEQQAGGGTFLHNLQSQIRSGVGEVQLIFTVPHTSAGEGRPKGYGKEVREAMRQIAKQANVNITGAEMPTSSLTNMSGFSPQRNEFSDEVLESHKQEVREAMSFLADVSGGGGVDVVAFEFPRTISDKPWANKGDLFSASPNEMKNGLKSLVDKETGKIIGSVAMGREEKVPDYKEVNGELVPELDEETGEPKMKEIKVSDFKTIRKEDGSEITPEEQFYHELINGQIAQSSSTLKRRRGELLTYDESIEEIEERLNNIKDERARKQLEREKLSFELRRDGARLEIGQLNRQVEEYKKQKQKFTSTETYGKERSFNAYAELGIHAMNETAANPKIEKDLWVGPEHGWPHSYGGHPDEWVELIQKSRDRMVYLLTNPEIENEKGEKVKNEFYRPDLNKKQAVKEAQDHIKGVFDTGHLGMWLTNFRRKPGETEKQREDEFKKWYLEQVDKIAKADVVGDIQVVDAQTGAHSHLPPGQGILPLKEAINKFKKAGYKGGIISEGHMEEQYGRGRILTETWKHFGAAPMGIYGAAAPGGMGPIYGTPWGNIQNAYFGRTYTPFFIVGAYSPSNDWKVWSEVPLE